MPNCRIATGTGTNGSGALQVDYVLEDTETNRILYLRDVSLRLSGLGSIVFEVKGSGSPASIFLFVYESRGRFRNCGPHGSNPDFTTGYADWLRLKVYQEKDCSCQGGEADFGDIQRTGFSIGSSGPKRGTVGFDNLACAGTGPHLEVAPVDITRNGDGLNDACRITYVAPEGVRLSVGVLNAAGGTVTALVGDVEPERPSCRLSWDGLAAGKPVADGAYALRATCSTGEPRELTAAVGVHNRPAAPPNRYQPDLFFPTGAWFEGTPCANGRARGTPDSGPAGEGRLAAALPAPLRAHLCPGAGAEEAGAAAAFAGAGGPASASEGEVRLGNSANAAGMPVLIVAGTRPGRPVTARLRGTPGKTGALSEEALAAQDGVLSVPLPPGGGASSCGDDARRRLRRERVCQVLLGQTRRVSRPGPATGAVYHAG